MLKLVHEYINRKWDETGLSLEKIRANILAKNPQASISVSKLHRVFSDPENKLSLEELIMLTRDGLQQNPQELLALIGGQEYAASKDVGYKGATELIADFERREAALRKDYQEQLDKEAAMRRNIHTAFTEARDGFKQAIDTLERTHAAALQKRDDTYDRVVGHLKGQLTKLEADNLSLMERASAAEAARDQIDKRRHGVFWGMLIALLSVLALFILFILIDAPQIGAGW